MSKFSKKEPLSLTPKDYSVYSDLLKQIFRHSPKLFVISDHTEAEKEIPSYVSRVKIDKATGKIIGETIPAEKYLKEKYENWFKWVKENFGIQQQEEILSDFLIKNRQPHPLDKSFNLQTNYILISEKELNEIFEKEGLGWEEFYKRYPDAKGVGIIRLSRVGFNFKEDKALVEINAQQHYLMGQGFLVLLEKENNTWIIQKRYLSRVS